MILEVPYYQQSKSFNCGPTNLKMVFSYFNKDFDIDTIEEYVGIKENKVVLSIQLANASAKLGFETEFYSESLSFNENYLDEYYLNNADLESIKKIKEIVDESEKNGAQLYEKTISLEELLSKITNNSIPIVLINTKIIEGKEGYNGHFVTLTGYDEENVYFHDSGTKKGKANYEISRELFDKARKADTDEDIIIIHQ